jgi:hypothetical protein
MIHNSGLSSKFTNLERRKFFLYMNRVISDTALCRRRFGEIESFCSLQRIYDRLQERYGRPEMVESAMKRKLNSFPTLTNKDNVKLYDLLDILTEIESVMLNPQYMLLTNLERRKFFLYMNRVISDTALCRRRFGEIVILHRMLH